MARNTFSAAAIMLGVGLNCARVGFAGLVMILLVFYALLDISRCCRRGYRPAVGHHHGVIRSVSRARNQRRCFTLYFTSLWIAPTPGAGRSRTGRFVPHLGPPRAASPTSRESGFSAQARRFLSVEQPPSHAFHAPFRGFVI